MEALDLAPVEHLRVADDNARDQHGEEAGAVRDRGEAVDGERARERAQRVQAFARQPHPGHEPARAEARRRCRRPRRRPSAARIRRSPCSNATPPPAACAPSSATIIAMPTGSLAPDSPSSSVPVRPLISWPPSTREDDGRVGRGERRAEQQRLRPAEAQEKVADQRRDRRRWQACRRHRARRTALRLRSEPRPSRCACRRRTG